jgi:hypothetical protein
MEFILTGLDWTSFNNDEELFEKIVAYDQIVMQATIAYINIWEYFDKVGGEKRTIDQPWCKCMGHLDNHANHVRFV